MTKMMKMANTTSQEQRDMRAISDAQDDDIDAQEIEPYDGCPRCGGNMSSCAIAIDEAHDDVYYGKRCESCGYRVED